MSSITIVDANYYIIIINIRRTQPNQLIFKQVITFSLLFNLEYIAILVHRIKFRTNSFRELYSSENIITCIKNSCQCITNWLLSVLVMYQIILNISKRFSFRLRCEEYNKNKTQYTHATEEKERNTAAIIVPQE